MTTFLLIRHGHTDWIGRALAGRTPGVGLSVEGREQAARLPQRLSRFGISAVYSSPLQRTIETAQPLAHALSLPVQEKTRLMEIDFGDWTGKTLDQVQADPAWQRFNLLRSISRAPNGELMLDVQSRMIDELEALRLAHPDETVAVFSHQDAIKAALAHYAGMPLDLFHRLEIHPAAISILQLADSGPRIVAMNVSEQF